MRLVELTSIVGNPVWIAPGHVRAVYPTAQGTSIDVGNDDVIRVTDKVADVVMWLNARLDP